VNTSTESAALHPEPISEARAIADPHPTFGNAVLVPTERVDEWLVRLEDGHHAVG
jgi:hypothetical protein